MTINVNNDYVLNDEFKLIILDYVMMIQYLNIKD